MWETAGELTALQNLLDRSFGRASAHLTSIMTSERRFAAGRLVAEIPSPAVLNIATVTATGEPLRVGVLVSGTGTNLQALLDSVHGREALVVAVQARPIEFAPGSSASGGSIRATWTEAGKAARNVKLMMSKVGNTWLWIGVLYLQG